MIPKAYDILHQTEALKNENRARPEQTRSMQAVVSTGSHTHTHTHARARARSLSHTIYRLLLNGGNHLKTFESLNSPESFEPRIRLIEGQRIRTSLFFSAVSFRNRETKQVPLLKTQSYQRFSL